MQQTAEADVKKRKGNNVSSNTNQENPKKTNLKVVNNDAEQQQMTKNNSENNHEPLAEAFAHNFLGHSPKWYKLSILAFLIINPIVLQAFGPFITGWLMIGEFIFTLALALKCYPLQPGGLLTIEAILMGLTNPQAVYDEAVLNFPVIILLVFMVAGVYFLKDLLLYAFSKIFLGIRSKTILSIMFSFAGAVLSAFLDALTVTAVLITVASGFYAVYHKVVSSRSDIDTKDLDQYRAFLRSVLMHGVVGTALGGVCTLVGEPQNLLIAKVAGWEFMHFFIVMAPVTMPVLVAGLITCVLLEKTKILGYGVTLPEGVRQILAEHSKKQDASRTQRQKTAMIVQGLVAGLIVLGLGFHVAEVGIIGLGAIILLTAFNGIVEEHHLGKAFEEALPFVSLLVVFFGIVSMIHEQHLFQPIIVAVLAMEKAIQPAMFYLANGVLSMVSDNVFVATVYISEVKKALDSGAISREHFDALAIAINTGTNIPSVATPNGQAAFLFLLTSGIAPLIRLDYARMVIMALPYTIVMGTVGFIAVYSFILPG